MKYGILLWPHQNSRYQEAVKTLAVHELTLLLRAARIEIEARYERVAGTDWLCFSLDELTDEAKTYLSRHSSLYLLCAMRAGGLFEPILSRAPASLGEDLTGILKYKGKTNEIFTHLLVNLALCASDFGRDLKIKPRLFDPMCGRGTTLFNAVNRGWDAVGSDADAGEIAEGEKFFKRYLMYHRLKHETRERSLTLPNGRSVKQRTLAFIRPDGAGEISFMAADAADAARALPAGFFHLIAADLPYGVQTGPGRRETFERLLTRSLAECARVTKPGGAIALSYNTHTVETALIRSLLERSGFEVMCGGPYDGMAHWVEQAIMRDVAVGYKRR